MEQQQSLVEPLDETEPASGSRLSHQEARDFVHQIAGLTEAGLPLPDGLRALGDELPPGSLRQTTS